MTLMVLGVWFALVWVTQRVCVARGLNRTTLPISGLLAGLGLAAAHLSWAARALEEARADHLRPGFVYDPPVLAHDFFTACLLLAGPLGATAVALLLPRNPRGQGLRQCPACAEWVRAEARVCRYCRAELRPPSVQRPSRTSLLEP